MLFCSAVAIAAPFAWRNASSTACFSVTGSAASDAGENKSAPDRSRKIPAQLNRFLIIFLTFPTPRKILRTIGNERNDKRESHSQLEERLESGGGSIRIFRKGVIPKPRVFTSGARDLPLTRCSAKAKLTHYHTPVLLDTFPQNRLGFVRRSSPGS